MNRFGFLVAAVAMAGAAFAETTINIKGAGAAQFLGSVDAQGSPAF